MIVRAQISWAGDTNFPRDLMTINPHFSFAGITPEDFQGFADALCTSMRAYSTADRETHVRLYDAQGSVPVYPEAVAVQSLGVIQPSGVPREVACCLSFFSGRNIPRRRGRLYVPAVVAGLSMAGRPSAAHRTKIGALATLLADAGGLDVDWVVYSPTDNSAHPVSNWWVDDEWDTVRSRGLRATTRLVGTVSE